MTAHYTIPETALELPRWLNPIPRGSPKMIVARAVMWGGYTHLQKGITHTGKYAYLNDPTQQLKSAAQPQKRRNPLAGVREPISSSSPGACQGPGRNW